MNNYLMILYLSILNHTINIIKIWKDMFSNHFIFSYYYEKKIWEYCIINFNILFVLILLTFNNNNKKKKDEK